MGDEYNFDNCPIDAVSVLTFEQAAFLYLRVKLGDAHRCPLCGNEVLFRYGRDANDRYTQSISAGCSTCQIWTDPHDYQAFCPSPVEFALTALTGAIREFMQRAERRRV